jgi:hypothetical protein
VEVVSDPPEPTEAEQEQPPERKQDEDAMSGAGHEDPEQALTVEEEDEE